MRKKATSGALTAQAIAGTRVVLLGMSVAPEARSKLMGFSIKRLDHASGKEGYLSNFLLFKANDKREKSDHSSRGNPVQAFQWSDFAATPGQRYTYTVTSMHGAPGALRPGDSVSLEVKTEDPTTGKHGVYFNRGAAGWQAYEREFGKLDPDQVPDRAGYKWLSRGLEEALIAFIAQAEDGDWGLRVAIYEFDYLPVLDAFWGARNRGVDVKIVVDEKSKSESPGAQNIAAIEVADLSGCKPRTRAENIPHNKFVVLLKEGEPVEVWTGSTNITKGGIYGHSNVGHVVRDRNVAAAFLEYWKQLNKDPAPSTLQSWTVKKAGDQPERWVKSLSSADLEPARSSTTLVFSPRESVAALKWYAKLMNEAEEGVFLTAPFGVGKELREVFENKKSYMRYLLLDHEYEDEVEGIEKIEGDVKNAVTVGAYLGEGSWHQWLEEHLTGFNSSVNFVHTKYMLIDPLSNDPIVISGSANFSKASTTENDENMLIVRGDTAVADVYLTEFMRLFSAFRLRHRVKARAGERAPAPKTVASVDGNLYLDPSPRWADEYYRPDSPGEGERLLFSGAPE
ncbi:MAG TPA: phospholipase D-like domain-containing protein [Solirubrobacterales bacterium]